LQIARHWPADMLVRAYASVLRVVDVPFHVGTYTAVVPYGLANPRLISAYKNTTQLNALAGLGVVSVALALTIISSRSVRAAVVLLALLIYFAGYPALQFQIRHFFHLEFIAWWAMAFVIDRAVVAPALLRRLRADPGAWRPSARVAAVRVLVFAGIAVLGLAGPVWALRAYQTMHVQRLVGREYLGAQPRPVATVPAMAADGRVLLDMSGLWSSLDPRETVATAYLVVELSSARCDALFWRARYRYDAETPASDFSHLESVAIPDGYRPAFVL